MRRLLVPTQAALIALTSVVATTPALAQYGGAPAPTRPVQITPQADTAAATPTAPALCQAGISKGARKALVALQAAVVAKNAAAIPGLVSAAQAVAKTPDDKCLIGILQVNAAIDAKDNRGIVAGLEAQLASGAVPAASIAKKYEALGQMHYDAKAYAEAGASYERSLQLAPGQSRVLIMLAETRTKQNRVADALPLYKKAIAAEIAAGRKPDERWFRRPMAVAYEAKSPLAYDLARELVVAFPSPTNWRDAIRIYNDQSGLDAPELVDMYRLARLNRALAGESDYFTYAQAVMNRGFAGEAKALLEEGFAANAIDRNKQAFKQTYAAATVKAAGDRAGLEGQAKAALASPAAKQAMVLGEAYFGYGDYAKAAAMFRAAQGKSGVDAELANLRLGMALAASGDKAGATAALAKVTGPRAEIARYWQAYANTRP